MGYNVTKLSILQMEKHLASIYNLLNAKERDKMEWSFDTEYLASRFLYRLRQAIHSANKLAIPPYDELAGRFNLRQHGRKIEAEKKAGIEFKDVEGKIVEDVMKVKGTDSFQIISSLLDIDLSLNKEVLLVDIKEVSPVLKGWLDSINCTYNINKKGILITIKKEEENATSVEETNLDRHGVA